LGDPRRKRWKRLASLTFAALALSVLIVTPSQAEPTRFFFEQGHAAVAFWQSTTATEQTTTVVTFFTADRGSVPGERTTKLLVLLTDAGVGRVAVAAGIDSLCARALG
jgi:hypothetical protein